MFLQKRTNRITFTHLPAESFLAQLQYLHWCIFSLELHNNIMCNSECRVKHVATRRLHKMSSMSAAAVEIVRFIAWDSCAPSSSLNRKW